MSQSGDYPEMQMILDVTNPVAMDLLEPLDDYLKNSDKLSLDMFLQASVNYNKVDGKLYAIPGLAVTYSHLANVDLLNKIGMKVEDLTSWDKVKETIKAVTNEKAGVYGYAMANGGEGRFTFRDFEMVCLSNDLVPDDVSN